MVARGYSVAGLTAQLARTEISLSALCFCSVIAYVRVERRAPGGG